MADFDAQEIARQVVADLNADGFDFEADISIDPEALDIEWLEQPNIMRRYSMAAVIARKERDIAKMAHETAKAEAKEEQDKLRSRLYLEAKRGGKELLKLDKDPSEGAIAAWVSSHPDLQEKVEESTADIAAAFEAYLSASSKYGFLTSAIQAIEARKSALENEVRLLGMNYFASPKEPRDLGAAYTERLRERNKAVKQSVSTEREKARATGTPKQARQRSK